MIKADLPGCDTIDPEGDGDKIAVRVVRLAKFYRLYYRSVMAAFNNGRGSGEAN